MKPGPTRTLVYGDVAVARVVEEDCELVSIVGSYRLLPGVRDDPTHAELAAWHDARVARAAARREGRDKALSPAEAERFGALARSQAWALVDADGTRCPIEVPDFLSGDKIVWRWSPR